VKGHGSQQWDQASIGAGFSRPGADTRQWGSFGTVDADTPDSRSVRFNDEDGNPLPFPLVAVTLQPSAVSVLCRVGAGVAGDGEGEWFPFVAGDEVWVEVPQGNERAGCTITRRLPNGIDAWPRTVAGMDATQNNFAFKRLRTPYVLETAASYLVRNAANGAQLALDDKGQFLVNDGDGARLFLSADALGFQSADGSCTVQIQVASSTLLLQGGDTTSLEMGSSGAQFLTQGTLAIGTGGMGATGHAITLEQVCNLIANLIVILSSVGAFDSSFVATFPVGFPANLAGYMTQLLNGAASPTPITASSPGGGLDTIGLSASIVTALLAQPPDLAGITGVPIPFTPGIGRQSFLL
jgi:hypothetical protein